MAVLIRMDKPRMVKGLPCWQVDGEWWPGFQTTEGSLELATDGPHAYLEYHGHPDDLRPGGRQLTPAGPRIVEYGWNFLPLSERRRLDQHPRLWYAALNKPRLRNETPAVTAYNATTAILRPSLTFTGRTRSVTVNPPILTRPEPLNTWIEAMSGPSQ